MPDSNLTGSYKKRGRPFFHGFIMHAQQHHSAFTHVHAHANRVHRNGQAFFEVTASTVVRATPRQAWDTLTDYDHLAGFVPDLRESKLVSRNGRIAVVEQRSQAGFLFVSQSVHMRLRVEETPLSAIDVTLIEGDMRHYAAHWKLAAESTVGIPGTRVDFHCAIEPDFFVPPLIGRPIVQAYVTKMLEAVMAEIERRGMH